MARNAPEEQDAAAGGEIYRRVKLPDGGEAMASVSIQRFPKSHQEWGYLRFKTAGKTRRFYIGKVSSATRQEALLLGWTLVREKKVIERAGLTWFRASPKIRQKS